MARRAGLLLAVGVCLGCDPSFEPQTIVDDLRVFAVHKDNPYPRPGDDLTLTILWGDGSEEAPRDIEILWISGCFNPPGDLFTGCLDSFAELDMNGGNAGEIGLGEGNQYTFQVPADIISRQGAFTGGQRPFGTAFVFFAACAGRIDEAPVSDEELEFPIACYGPDGAQLGADDFVAGYSQTFIYDDLTNNNPIITGVKFRGQEVTSACIGPACEQPPMSTVECGVTPCVAPCAADGDKKECPEFTVEPIVDRASAEVDDGSTEFENRQLLEQIWMNYYADGGRMGGNVKLVNDAIEGFNDDFSAVWRPPAKPGVYHIYSVVHDNRGGADWVRFAVGVQ